jgi:hypothetical protein
MLCVLKLKDSFIKLDKEMDMKKTILTISFASSIAFAPVTTLAQEAVEQDVGNCIVQRLDNRGDHLVCKPLVIQDYSK